MRMIRILNNRSALGFSCLGLCWSIACSGNSGAPALAGATAGSDGGTETAEGPDDGGTKNKDGSAGKDGAGPASAGFRVGPGRLAKATRNLDPTSRYATDSALRCPRGSLLTGIDIGGPDPNGGAKQRTADIIRLVCSELASDGTVGPGKAAPHPFNPALAEVWTSVRCPSGEVATHVTGTHDDFEFITLGLRCAPPKSLADGAAIATGNASSPPSFGGPAAASSFDDPCGEGSALGGFVLQYTVFLSGGVEGFTSMRGLCREVLEKKIPGGGDVDPGKPISLGPKNELSTLNLSSPASSLPPTSLDCPAGSVVSAIDVATSPVFTTVTVNDLGLTCRALGEDGSLESETRVGLANSTFASATCLDGAAVRGLSFTEVDAGAMLPADVIVSCAIPAPGNSPSSAIPAAAPGHPDLSKPAWKTTECPTGMVMTGLDFWRGTTTDSVVQAVKLRCRPAER